MTKFARLKKEAREAATWRGHQMGRFKTDFNTGVKGASAFALCSVCGAGAYILTKPNANEIDVAGLAAVATNCKD